MKHKFWIGIASFALLALGLASIVWLAVALTKTEPEFQAGIIAAVVAFVVAVWNQRAIRTREIDSRHFSEKRKIYNEFVGVMHRHLLAGKLGQRPLSERKLAEKLIEFKRNLLIWGDGATIDVWLKLEADLSTFDQREKGDMSILLVWDDVLRQFRKDLGKRDLMLKKGSLVALFLKADEHHKLWETAKK
ncbi:MAG: hypothetical protein F4222_09570 [Gammaproteobacteria bacterium]|nr:hypothetical protein [Gammaproteobacteria bacterium]MYF59301.1 hypothetical protein [Gammaproteobacteria bacterium]